MWTAFTFSA